MAGTSGAPDGTGRSRAAILAKDRRPSALGRHLNQHRIVAGDATGDGDAARFSAQPSPELEAGNGGHQEPKDKAGTPHEDRSSRLANSLSNRSSRLTIRAIATIGIARIAM